MVPGILSLELLPIYLAAQCCTFSSSYPMEEEVLDLWDHVFVECVCCDLLDVVGNITPQLFSVPLCSLLIS